MQIGWNHQKKLGDWHSISYPWQEVHFEFYILHGCLELLQWEAWAYGTVLSNQSLLVVLTPKFVKWKSPFPSNLEKATSGWWLTYPSEKYEFVSWDDDIPNWIDSHNNPWFRNHQPDIDTITPNSPWTYPLVRSPTKGCGFSSFNATRMPSMI
jgi:hypothetical protein